MVPFLATVLFPLVLFVTNIVLGKVAITAEKLEFFVLTACIFIIIFTFRLPRFRRLKYDAAFLGLLFLAFDSIAGENYQLVAVWVLTAIPIWFPLITISLHHYLFKKKNGVSFIDHRLRTMYRLTNHAFGTVGSITIFILWFAPTNVGIKIFAIIALFIFGSARYFSVEGLTHTPILYLRAFSSKGTQKNFKKLIVPAITPRRILVGLTPTKDRKSLIKRPFGLTQAFFYVVPDSMWQAWIRQEVSQALGVILDFTEPTANLMWELDLSKTVLSPERIIIIRGHDSIIPEGTSLPSVTYDGSRTSRLDCKKTLQTWLDSLEKQMDAQE